MSRGKQHPLVSALSAINRRFIGGFRTRSLVKRSCYFPHQGKAEIARRLARGGAY